jgi:hypothetical protein
MAFAGDHGCTGTVLMQSKKVGASIRPTFLFTQDRSVATADNTHAGPTP